MAPATAGACECAEPIRSPAHRGCARCGRPFPPARRSPIEHHCRRCGAAVPEGSSHGILYLLDHGRVTEWMVRLCRDCAREAAEPDAGARQGR